VTAPAEVKALVEEQLPHARAMLAHAERVEAEQTVRDLEESIRLVRIEKARKAYAEAKSRILSWTPGDTGAQALVLSEALGAADMLILALETPAAR
jgi:hypothetical protein